MPFHFLEFVVYTKYELLEKSVTQIKVEDINGIIDGMPIFYKKKRVFPGEVSGNIFMKKYFLTKKLTSSTSILFSGKAQYSP